VQKLHNQTKRIKNQLKINQKRDENVDKDEEIINKQACTLYRFAYITVKTTDATTGAQEEKTQGEWKQRGKGDIRFLKHKITQKIRLIMRQSSTYKLILNHYVEPTCQLKPNEGNANAWSWWGIDNSDTEESKSLFIGKFTDPAKFKKEYDDARTHMEKLPAVPAASTPASTPASTSTSTASATSTTTSGSTQSAETPKGSS